MRTTIEKAFVEIIVKDNELSDEKKDMMWLTLLYLKDVKHNNWNKLTFKDNEEACAKIIELIDPYYMNYLHLCEITNRKPFVLEYMEWLNLIGE